MKKIIIVFVVFLVSCNNYQKLLNENEKKMLVQGLQYELSNLDSSYKIARKMETLSKKNNKKILKAYSLLLLTRYYYHKQQYDSAINSVLSARKIFRKSKDWIGYNMAANEILNLLKHYKYIPNSIPKIETKNYEKKDENLLQLIKYEYVQAIISNSYYKRSSSDYINLDSLKKITDSILEFSLKIETKARENTIEKFYSRHLLAKTYYFKAFLVFHETHDTLKMLDFLKKSFHYDTLLHNRQAWSCFTIAEKYLELYQNEKNKTFLDSAYKFIRFEYDLLNLKKHKFSSYIDLTDSIIKDSTYFYHLSNLLNIYAKYLYITGKKDTAFSLLEKSQQLDYARFVPNYKLILKQKNIEEKLQRQTRNLLIIFLIFLFATILILSFLIKKYLKDKKLLWEKTIELENKNQQLKELTNELREKNKELNEEKDLRRHLVKAFMHKIKNIIIHGTDSATKNILQIENNKIYTIAFETEFTVQDVYISNIVREFKNIYPDANIINLFDEGWHFKSIKDFIHIAVWNILENAYFYNMDKNDLTITLRAEENDKEIKIFISNNGKKIDDKLIPYLFELKENKGIGLYLTKYFIEKKLNGSISLKQNNDELTFIITLYKP